jgi:hypothetical protein
MSRRFRWRTGLRGDDPGAVALREIVPTMRRDAQLVRETADSMEQ